MPLQLTSSAFNENEMIPSKYTCDGANISPPLSWSGIPDAAKSFALILDDPDAPNGTFDHWVLFNIPADVNGFSEGPVELPKGSIKGMTDFGKPGYGGPCPPSGTHRYHFKLYALSDKIELDEGVGKEDVEKAMEPLILEKAELVGLYSR